MNKDDTSDNHCGQVIFNINIHCGKKCDCHEHEHEKDCKKDDDKTLNISNAIGSAIGEIKQK